MNLYVPEYYPAFHCVASRCRHTCCAGWEIDIDDDSLARSERLPGEFGERVRQGISRDETPHFILTEGERCPLLNGDNLCELILHEYAYHLCGSSTRLGNCLGDILGTLCHTGKEHACCGALNGSELGMSLGEEVIGIHRCCEHSTDGSC